jgi:ABC-type oligopeptide transport system ATPase subunit
MMDLQDELGLTYLFVAHDLSVVNQISNIVLVMYVGRVAEIGPPQDLFKSPKRSAIALSPAKIAWRVRALLGMSTGATSSPCLSNSPASFATQITTNRREPVRNKPCRFVQPRPPATRRQPRRSRIGPAH